mgnify:CR=1 FL=1
MFLEKGINKNSNTTLVKVKSFWIHSSTAVSSDSNTTLVKVKFHCVLELGYSHRHSNTTLVKVKFPRDLTGKKIGLPFKYNTC